MLVATTDNGEVFVFGEGMCGQLGVGKPLYSRYPRRLPAPLNAEFVDVGAGDTTTYALTSTLHTRAAFTCRVLMCMCM